MRKFQRPLAAAAIVCLGVVSLGFGGSGAGQPHDFTEAQPGAQAQDEYVVVVFTDPPAASYTGGVRGLEPTKPPRGQQLDANDPAVRAYVDYLASVHTDYEGYLASKAPAAQVVREFSLVANALAIKRNGTRIDALAGGPGVDRVAPSGVYRPVMTISNDLIGATGLRDASGADGSGIKVGIIDSGIDPTHSFFDCTLAAGPKVVFQGIYSSDPTVVEAEQPAIDHGTHVAGTVGGCEISLPSDDPVGGEISGVAPAVQLHDYNVFPCDCGAFSHDIAAALEDAVVDGMDIVNMSLGGSVEGPHDFLAEATNTTVDAGVVAAVAAGNSGPGDMTVSSPGSAEKALTVGASTNPHFVGIPVTVGAATFGAALGDFDNFGVVTADYTVTTPANGCTTIAESLKDKIALIDRGACTFTTKIRNAEERGAIGVLVVNNVAGDPVAMGHDGTDPFPAIPAAMLGKADGNEIKPSGTATVDGTNLQEFVTDNEDIIAGFSSRGPSPFTYLIKPEVTAPGVNVYSSVLDDGWAFFQGTSMATPHVAGAAALLLELHAGWAPADVKSALVSTAKRPVYDHVNGTDATGVLTRGGGRISLPAASEVPVTLDPAAVSFGLWDGNKYVSASRTVEVYGSGTCGLSVAQTEGPAGLAIELSATSVSAPGSFTVSIDGGKKTRTGSGDYAGDITLTCGSTTLTYPWWTRIDREALSTNP